MQEAERCGHSVLASPLADSLPKSMFSKSDKNGLYLYSPYLCGTGLVDFLNTAYDWGTKCWDRSGFVVGFFHLYNMLFENGHISKPIDVFERVISVFQDDLFRGRRRPTSKDRSYGFTTAFELMLGSKAHSFADAKTRRRLKGGCLPNFANETSMRNQGKTTDHTLFKSQSKLFALSQANYLKDRIDTSSFPALATAPRTSTGFLDAMKTELKEEIEGKSPVALLNYSAITAIIMILFQALDESMTDLPSAKLLLDKQFSSFPSHEVDIHAKVLYLAFFTDKGIIQDISKQRLDSPILRKMGKTLEDTWKEVGPEIIPVLLLNDASEPTTDDSPKHNRRSEKMIAETMRKMKMLDPSIANELEKALKNQEIGPCSSCPDCQAGVKFDAMKELKTLMEGMGHTAY